MCDNPHRTLLRATLIAATVTLSSQCVCLPHTSPGIGERAEYCGIEIKSGCFFTAIASSLGRGFQCINIAPAPLPGRGGID